MTSSTADARAVQEVRVPATSLRPGDLVNLSPGEDDWQQVLGVYLEPGEVGSATPELRTLVESLGGRYVVVELTDLAPVDNNIYFSGGQALTVGTEGDDQPVSEVVSTEDGLRTYLYTKYELVTVRGH